MMNIEIPLSFENLDQDQEYILLDREDKRLKIKLHDYKTIFSIPGLYEKIVYELLECNSPKIITQLLIDEISKTNVEIDDLNILDMGAGNGIVAEELQNAGVNEVIGVDIIEEAKNAALRDRPEVYNDYIVDDLAKPNINTNEILEENKIDCVTCVAAIGFGDIPPKTLANAINFTDEKGWIAISIKEDFLKENDNSGLCDLYEELIQKGIIDVKMKKKYVHRKSLTGKELKYDAIIAQKNCDIPDQIINNL